MRKNNFQFAKKKNLKPNKNIIREKNGNFLLRVLQTTHNKKSKSIVVF
jgi:hypothetical protein